jgi:CO/xanthine dehydrogenase FAD-binding subunit
VKDRELKVYRPRSLNGLLRLYSLDPDALLYAGGTAIALRAAAGRERPFRLPPRLVMLGNVPELGRITRTPRHLDIGAGVTLSRALSTGRNVLPAVLAQAIASVGTPPVRNLGTIGGNLCAGWEEGGAVPSALAVLDGQVELRSASGARWVRAWLAEPRRGEVLTRVRIPMEEWQAQGFRRLPSGLTLAAAARLGRGALEALHFCLAGPGFGLLRSRELEDSLKNARLPLAQRARQSFLRELDERLSSPGLSSYVRATSVRLADWFLDRLEEAGVP